MTTKLYNASNSIIDLLREISSEKGYSTTPTVLSGWLNIYERDLISGKNGMGFPVLCAYYEKDSNQRQDGTPDNRATRILTIAGAVKIEDGEDVNLALDQLVFDTKKALASVAKLTIPEINYMLPESSLDYAMFVAKVQFNVTEKWQ